jgi:hypothetical protein
MKAGVRVLCGTDGSAPALAALISLLDVFRPGALKIDVVCVVPRTPELPVAVWKALRELTRTARGPV